MCLNMTSSSWMIDQRPDVCGLASISFPSKHVKSHSEELCREDGTLNPESNLFLSVYPKATKSYCFFEKGNGNGSMKLSICWIISAKPSVPKCWVEGAELVGEAVSLHCKSVKGSTPLTYTWRRESADHIPAPATQGKRDLCWHHDATTYQREHMYVCAGVRVGDRRAFVIHFQERKKNDWNSR